MDQTSCITLIGMPGAGKSTLGVVLAKIMNYNFIDADLLIQNQSDKTLQKIIDALGPEGFIEVENEVLSTLEAQRSVIATGGSAVYSDGAMTHLATLGPVVYLRVSYDELKNRLGGLHERGVVMKSGTGRCSISTKNVRRCTRNMPTSCLISMDSPYATQPTSLRICFLWFNANAAYSV